jgi:hypothetical protein
MIPSDLCKYTRLVEELADNVRSQCGTDKQPDYKQVKELVMAGMIRRMRSLNIVPVPAAPAEKDRLLEERLVADALEKLAGPNVSILGSNQTSKPERPAGYREAVEELAGKWWTTLEHGALVTRQQLGGHVNRPMRDRVKRLGVVPTGATPEEANRLIVQVLVADALGRLASQGKLEARTVDDVEQYYLIDGPMVPSAGGDGAAEDDVIAKHLHEGAAAPVTGLVPAVNERSDDSTGPEPDMAGRANSPQDEVIEPKAADDPTGEGSRRPAGLLDIVIDPEFGGLLPERTAEELAQLEANLLRDKVCLDSLKVWKGRRILLDGHGRRPILLKHPHLRYTIDEIDLPDREAARGWVLACQLGRRNLSREAASYYRGKLYESQKHQGNRTDLTCAQSEQKLSAAEQLAREHNVSASTIRRDAGFAADLDVIVKNCGDQVRRDILSGHSRLTKEEIGDIARMSPDEQRQAIAEPSRRQNKKGGTQKKAGNTAANGHVSADQACEMQTQDEGPVMAGLGQEPGPIEASPSAESHPGKTFLDRLTAVKELASGCVRDVATLAGALTDQEKANAIDKARSAVAALRQVLESLGEREETDGDGHRTTKPSRSTSKPTARRRRSMRGSPRSSSSCGAVASLPPCPARKAPTASSGCSSSTAARPTSS